MYVFMYIYTCVYEYVYTCMYVYIPYVCRWVGRYVYGWMDVKTSRVLFEL